MSLLESWSKTLYLISNLEQSVLTIHDFITSFDSHQIIFHSGFRSQTNLSFIEHSISVRENLHSRSGSHTMAKHLPVIQSAHLSAELSTSSPPVHFHMSLSTTPPTKNETCSYGSKSKWWIQICKNSSLRLTNIWNNMNHEMMPDIQ